MYRIFKYALSRGVGLDDLHRSPLTSAILSLWNFYSNIFPENRWNKIREVWWVNPGWGPTPPALTLAFPRLFDTLFVPPSSVQRFGKNGVLSKHVFTDVPPAWPRDWAVAGGGSVGAGHARHGAVSAPPHQGHPAAPHCQHLDTDIQYSLHKPATFNCFTYDPYVYLWDLDVLNTPFYIKQYIQM